MELEYTLVTAPSTASDPRDLIKAYGQQGQDQFDVVQIKPTPREVTDLRKDEKTIALTPTMPVTLISPVKTNQGHLASGERVAWGVESVQADRSRFSGRGAIVAVLDTGIATQHPAFTDVSVDTRNFTDDASVEDRNGHGTHCAGTVAGQSVGGVRIGVAPDVEQLLIGKVLSDEGHGSTTAIVKGVQWASLNGAHVISMSLGIDFPAYVEMLHKQQGIELKSAVSLALQAYTSNVDMFSKLGDSLSALSYIGQGSLLVAAAGNESRRPQYTIATSPPAVASSILSVAAVDSAFKVAAFSNTDADVCAPGVDIASAGTGEGLAVLSGTSMAAPHVAGVAALWIQKFLETGQAPGVEQLRGSLFSSVKLPEGTRSEDYSDFGRGLVQAPLL